MMLAVMQKKKEKYWKKIHIAKKKLATEHPTPHHPHIHGHARATSNLFSSLVDLSFRSLCISAQG